SRWSVSIRLSRIKAWASLASPCATLMKSKTTRRSAPITRSRLRKPTSKSTTQTRLPLWASAAPKDAVDVVLPTPPFPDVTTITLLMRLSPKNASTQDSEFEFVAVQPGLEAAALHLGARAFRRDIGAADAQQFGSPFGAEDARRLRARDSGDHAPLQRAIDVNGAAGDDFRARGDPADDGHVSVGMHDRLARAHGAVHDQGVGMAGGRAAGRRLLLLARGWASIVRPPERTGGRCGPTSPRPTFSAPMTLMCRRARSLRSSRYSLRLMSS